MKVFDKAEMQQQTYINVSSILAAMATAAVVLRLLARGKARAYFGADDLLVSISLIPLWSLVITGAVSEHPNN